MNVTEIALLRLREGEETISPTFLSIAKQNLDIQNDWHAAAFPHLPSTLAERASYLFQQVEDPSRLLITAKWESIEAHYKWVGSEENVAVMTELGQAYLTSDPADVILFHLDGDIFGATPVESDGEGLSLCDSPVVRVERLFVDLEKKDEFVSKLSAAKSSLKKAAVPHLVRGGWRLDGDAGARQQYVLVSGWASLEKHEEFINSPDASPHSELKAQLVAEKDVRHFRCIL